MEKSSQVVDIARRCITLYYIMMLTVRLRPNEAADLRRATKAANRSDLVREAIRRELARRLKAKRRSVPSNN